VGSIDLIQSYTTRWQIMLVEGKGGLTVSRQMAGMFSCFLSAKPLLILARWRVSVIHTVDRDQTAEDDDLTSNWRSNAPDDQSCIYEHMHIVVLSVTVM
jgi:hypothetical protein